jgi:hypothetical protein
MRWSKGPPRDSIDRNVAQRHSAAEPPTDPPPSFEVARAQVVRAERQSIRAMMPWWRRFVAWVGDFHKFVIALISIASATVAIHVWLKGLITRAELEVAVEAATEKAVVKTLLDVKTDVSDLKTNTAGLPAWRKEATTKLDQHDTRIGVVEHQEENLQGRFDKYLRKN